ncbi:MAG: PepSY domain-containing protein, partial [Lentihominibacter sp.]
MTELKGKNIRKPVIAMAVAAVVVIAGASVYAASGGAAGSGDGISVDEAKSIALEKVKGASESDIVKAVRDTDDGREEYDVEIIYDGYEYDIELSAEDGRLHDISKEKADAADLNAGSGASQSSSDQAASSGAEEPVVVETASPSSDNSSDAGLAKAKKTALAQVPGASESDIVKAHKDYDDGRQEYEVEIRYNGYEYEYEIDA